MKRFARLLPLLVLTFAATAIAQQRRLVTFHLEKAPFSVRAFAINNHRQVAGTVGREIGDQEGFVWAHGKFRDIFEFDFVPNALEQTQVFGINDFGQTVGIFASEISGENSLAFVRDKHGNATRLPLVNDTAIPLSDDINNAGTIVGWYQGQLSDPFDQSGFILAGGHYTSLVYPGARYTAATGVNEAETVVGWYSAVFNAPHIAFIYANGEFQSTFRCVNKGVAQSTEPTGINDFGQIVGNCGDRMFVRDALGTITFVDPAGITSLTPPLLEGINNHGDLTGYFQADTGSPFFRWDSFVIYNAVRPH